MVRKNFIYYITNGGGGSGGNGVHYSWPGHAYEDANGNFVGWEWGYYSFVQPNLTATYTVDPGMKVYFYKLYGSVQAIIAMKYPGHPILQPGGGYDFSNLNPGDGGATFLSFLLDDVGQAGGGSDIFESIINYLGYNSSVVENGMKASLLSLNEIKSLLIAKRAPTEIIDNIISRDATIGGVARIGGQLIFYTQLGYNIYNVVNNPTLSNMALKSSDTFFSGIATYGGWPGLGIAGIYYLNRESIIITMKSLNQGLIKSNSNIMQNYIGGLGITPFVNNW